MARVNNGNLLQHAIECHAAATLATEGAGLYLVATHAMAPFEAAERPDPHEHNRALRDLLGAVACLPPEAADASSHAVMRAYAHAAATTGHYPNTAELLAALLGRERIAGLLCEVDPAKRAALATAWAGTAVRIEGRPWRELVPSLLPPPDLDRPWLFTMDPYTWKHGGECKQVELGPHLEPKDFDALRRTLGAYVGSAFAGAFTAFVYGVDESHARSFRKAALKLADRLGLARVIVGVSAPDGQRHLGAVLASDPDLPAETAEAWHEAASTLGLA